MNEDLKFYKIHDDKGGGDPALSITMTLIKKYFWTCPTTHVLLTARTVPPTNTNLWLIFLLTRLQGAPYEDLAV